MPQGREPYPFPKYENDNAFSGNKACQKLPFKTPTHIAQTEEPWSRLNSSPTVSSMKRSVLYQETPKDSLDFHLTAAYDNHLDFLLNKNETLFQKDSLMRDIGVKYDDDVKYDANNEIRMWSNPQKVSIYNTEGAIGSHHNASTNRGYSRKDDGGFFST